ncbi:hypothetical protein [Paenibacillus antarcticus]|uniref:hypothetical protein n=1 Tax=Paenibacillus antarcticus TaxID=253703 RepID=UPI000A41A458|nr:hypothetical protein [Paenibacillus antarcticus]
MDKSLVSANTVWYRLTTHFYIVANAPWSLRGILREVGSYYRPLWSLKPIESKECETLKIHYK